MVAGRAPAAREPCTAPAAPASDGMLSDVDFLTEEIGSAVAQPIRRPLPPWGRAGANRVDGGHETAERIRDMADSGIAVTK